MSFMNRRETTGRDSIANLDERKREFERVALPLVDSLFNFARWLTGNSNDAEDLVQETYLKAWKGYESFRADCSFQTWIFRILRNTFLSSLTSRRTSLTESLDDDQHQDFLPCTDQTPESILVDQAHLSVIRSALEEIPLAMREIILLREVEEMSYQNISQTLDIPVGTVMSRLARARKALRQMALSKLGRYER